ncbi:MAG: LuxR C-terminal-related transcriptional regulator [Kofleriaceae bacterium]
MTAPAAEVLGYLARGREPKEIASALGIPGRTVKQHLEHIRHHTGITTRAGAALFAARHELVAPDRAVDPES